MWMHWLTRLVGGRKGPSAGRLFRPASRPAARSCSLRLETLEDRTVPSGGPGPSSLLSGSGGSSGGPAPSGIVSTSGSTSGGSGSNSSGSSSGGPSQTTAPAPDLALPSPTVVNYVNQMLSKLVPGGPGYPLPPSIGPTQTGTLVDPTNVSALPVSLQQSAVAVVPLTVYSVDPSTAISTVTPPSGYTATVVTVTSGQDTSMYLVVTTVSTAGVAVSNTATASPAGC
jgi:hypothetical protein